MARLPRISSAGVPVHLIQRGNNRHTCFGALEDYSAYVGWLKEYSKKYAVDIHAWVLMTNHVHLLCMPQQDGAVSLMMQSVGRSSVCAIFQLSVSAKRYTLGGALQIVPGSGREIPSRGLSIYRIESGKGKDGGRPT